MFDADGVIELRKKLGETQRQFAARLGISVWTVRDWEQNRYPPPGMAQKLLAYIQAESENPETPKKSRRRVQSPKPKEEPIHAEIKSDQVG